jgi:hypothetical protein
MRSTVIVLLGTLSVGMAALPAFAQETPREAAIRACVQRVAAIVGMEPDKQAERIAAYKACMTQLGQAP